MEAKKPEEGAEDLSMEDILQSIRRIIADEENGDGEKSDSKQAEQSAIKTSESSKSEQPKTSALGGDDVVGSDILELTDMIEDDGSITTITAPQVELEAVDLPEDDKEDNKPAEEAKPEPEPAAFDQSSIDEMFGSAALVEPAPAPPAVSMPEPPAQPAAKPEDDFDALISKTAETAALSALEKLKIPEEPPPLIHPESPIFRSGNTVEDMVAEMLHPMLKEWLESNLPAIVERIVEREVMRLTRKYDS